MTTAEDFIRESTLTNELKHGFGEYSRYVISDRALPDARDGLKPVHRRIIYAMYGLGLTHRSSFKKCARIVGEVTGKYHPHAGGTYESLVRLAQDWSLRYPLVEGQGNFGSIDGFPPAAMRYTEARLEKISQELLADLSPKVVKFVDNFDGEEREPTVLPVRVPHLLLNGAKGIAVGMSSNIPPHQLGELIDGAVAIIDNPMITIDELMTYVKGPDFPTGGLIVGTKGIENLYRTGKGSIRLRSRIHVERPDTHKVKEPMLVVDEIPYFVNKTSLIEEIAELINSGKIRGITNVRDLSKDKIRIEIVVEEGYSDDESLRTVQAQLFKRTNLETMFHGRILAFVYGRPRTLNLKQALSIFLDFREDVVLKRSEEELEKVMARLHILEGLIKASQHIDEIIAMIRASENRSEAQQNLMNSFDLSDKQAKAVLDMTLARLARVEQDDLQKEAEARTERALFLQEIINNRSRRLEVIKEELLQIKQTYNDSRRTTILEHDEIDLTNDRELLHERKLLITSTSEGYLRSIDFEKFKVQGRAGVGVIGVPLNENEQLLDFTIASNKDDLLLITEEGIVHKIPAFEVIEVSKRTQKGRKLNTYLPVSSRVKKIVPIKEDEFTNKKVLVTVTKHGIIKRTTLDKFRNIRKNGIKCLLFKEEDDSVADAFITDGDSYIFMATKFGHACVFEEKLARLTGRVAQGVIGVSIKEPGDEVISSFAVPKDKFETATVLTLTEKGYGKRTYLSKYRITKRGAKGVKNIKITNKNGYVTASLYVPDVEGVIPISLISSSGKIIKVNVNTIRIMGRNTQGVRVMRLTQKEKLVFASLIVDDSEIEEVEEAEVDDSDVEITDDVDEEIDDETEEHD
ncbi:MAG: DNA topoisomerase 4 subunit A [Methanobacteriota archaeon]|nr:MAG: DNA topoisomerase 4 subunit A [Euryarchaeota archaeon]